jgi:hypothetical protein
MVPLLFRFGAGRALCTLQRALFCLQGRGTSAQTMLQHAVAVLVCVLTVCVSAGAGNTAIWSSASMGDSGRAGQSSTINGPRVATLPVGYDHIMQVTWRWNKPGSVTFFHYGGIDSDGFLFYLETGNGAFPHIVHKISAVTGESVWTSTPPPPARYGDFAGNDHLLVWQKTAVFVVAGSRYSLPDCGWVQVRFQGFGTSCDSGGIVWGNCLSVPACRQFMSLFICLL